VSTRYTFSGHESFPCKSLWLKKGYDFVSSQKNFNSDNAVVELGVGKNMVSAIRYWLKSFGLYDEDGLTDLAHYLFDDNEGRDPYMEDLATLWLLHFMLVYTNEATLYNWTFMKFQRERKQFDRLQLLSFVKREMTEAGKIKIFNENTMKKDIGILLQNYVLPKSDKSFEDFSSLLIDLNLIHQTDDGKAFYFNIDAKRKITPDIFLYAIVMMKGEDKTVSFDLIQDISLIFCMNGMETIKMMKYLSEEYSKYVSYNEVAGIRQLQFVNDIESKQILEHHYRNAKI